MLRVIRGAGKPHELGLQMDVCLQAMESYFEAYGFYPSAGFIQLALRPAFEFRARTAELTDEQRERRWDDGTAEQEWALEEVIAGSLQYTASTLVGQPLQMQKGKEELEGGAKRYGEARAKMSSYYAQRRKKRK